MYQRKNFIDRYTRPLWLLAPALALASPAFANDAPASLADQSTPGSVIVFPKYVKGTVSVDGAPAEKTEIEVGVVCPKGATCAEHQSVKLRFHWVCPATQDFNTKFICKENDFDVFTSVNGKVVFDPDGVTIAGSAPVTVPAAPCPAGYLIGWVINPANDQPTKFDGLMGDAVIRGSGTAVQSYRAIAIQADPNLPVSGDPTKVAITTGLDRLTGTPTLLFGQPGGYQTISGAINGDVRYTNPNGPTTYANTWLILMTSGCSVQPIELSDRSRPRFLQRDRAAGFDLYRVRVLGAGGAFHDRPKSDPGWNGHSERPLRVDPSGEVPVHRDLRQCWARHAPGVGPDQRGYRTDDSGSVVHLPGV